MVHDEKERSIDAMYGPTDLFMYGATKVVTKISLSYETLDPTANDKQVQKRFKFNPEQSRLSFIELDQCLKMLGDIPPEVFVDALFLVGSSSLEPFPPLRESLGSSHSLTFKEVVVNLLQCGGNVFRFCERSPLDVRDAWLDRYMRAVQAIRHMIVLFKYDLVKPRTYLMEQRSDRAPSDLHDLIGFALPPELNYYLFRGMIGPRVLNWLISGKIRISAPLAGGDSDAYRKLVREQLDPWRKQAVAMIAFNINRYFQQKEIITSFWFGSDADQKFIIKDLSQPKKIVASWRVTDQIASARLIELQVGWRSTN
jgi:hypothetical protein